MTAAIYLLAFLMIACLVVCIYFLLKLMASFLSFSGAADEAGRDAPWRHFLTGGFESARRVLRHKGNDTAMKALWVNAVLLVCSSLLLGGAVLVFMKLNANHCVFSVTRTTADGTRETICPKQD